MTIKKHIKFRAPYLFSTFNANNNQIVGGNGVLFGMDVTTDGSDIWVGAGSFILNGLICEMTTSLMLTPTAGVNPLYLIVSTASALENDPVTWSFTSELSELASNSAVLVAKYNGYEWVSADKISAKSIISERNLLNLKLNGRGVYEGFRSRIDDTYSFIELDPGTLVDSVGARYTNAETCTFNLDNLDVDFPRRDLVVYRRSVDDWRRPGLMERITGTTYSTSNFLTLENIKETQVSSTGTNLKPQVLIDDSNNQHILWLSGATLYYSKYNSARTTNLVATTVVETAVTEFHACLDNLGKINIVGKTGTAIFFKRISGSGVELISGRLVDSQPNDVGNPVIGVDRLNNIYIVYYHVENPSGPNYNRQLYFTKLNYSDGTTNIVPTQITDDANDYITPRIAIDNDRQIHIVMENTVVNSIRYMVLLNTGVIKSDLVDLSDDTGGNFGSGYLTAFGATDCETPDIKISNLGDVYVCWAQERDGTGGKKSLIVYHPRFKDTNGFKAIALGMDNKNLGYGQGGYGDRGYGRDLVDRTGTITAGENIHNPRLDIDGYHNIHFVFDSQLLDTEAHCVWHVKMSNAYFVNVRFLIQLGPNKIKHTFTITDVFSNPSFAVDKTGSLAVAWTDQTNIYFNKNSASIFTEGFVESDQEVWITEMSLPKNTINKYNDVAITDRQHNNIIDKTNKVTVGLRENTADFVGDHGLKEALEYLKGFGGVVEILSGNYQIGNPYEIYSGIVVRQLGKVHIEKIGGIGPTFTMTGKLGTMTDVYDYYFTDAITDFRAEGFLIGDTVDILTVDDTFLQRTYIVGIDGTGGVGGTKNINVHLKHEILPGAAKYKIYRSGAELHDLTILGNPFDSNVRLQYANKCKVIGIESSESYLHGIEIENSFNCLIKNNICLNNASRGIRVKDCMNGGVYVVNNICVDNSSKTDFVDIEFTATTEDNFVTLNRGTLVDNGTNNQPPQQLLTSIANNSFNDFVIPTKIKYPDMDSGEPSNPMGITADENADVGSGFKFIPIESLRRDPNGNYELAGTSNQAIIVSNGKWNEGSIYNGAIKYLYTNSKNAELTLTYYGTGLVMLTRRGPNQATDVTKSLNGGGGVSFSLEAEGSLSDDISAVTLYDEQALGVYTVKIRREDSSNDKTLEIYGFQVLREASGGNIAANTGYVYFNGILYKNVENELEVGNNTAMARTDVVVAETDGNYAIITGSSIPTGVQRYLGNVESVGRDMEEISIRQDDRKQEVYKITEFSNFDIDNESFYKIESLDSTIMMWAEAAGIYSGAKKDVSTFNNPSIKLLAPGDKLTMIFKGTGLSINIGSFSGLNLEAVEVWIDDVNKGYINAPIVTRTVDMLNIGIASNMKDTSHMVEFISKSTNTNPCLFLQGFSIFRAKKPTIEANQRQIAVFRVANITNNYIIHDIKKVYTPYGSSWNDLGFVSDRINGCGLTFDAGLDHYFEVPFYGTGIKLYYVYESGTSIASVFIDDQTPSSLGAAGSGDTLAEGVNPRVANMEAMWYDLPLGYHVLKIVPTTLGKVFMPNAVGIQHKIIATTQQRIISPVHGDILKL